MSNLRIADLVFSFTPRFDELNTLCRAYQCDAPAQVIITVSDAMLAAEQQKDPQLPPALHESNCLQRQICRALLDYDGFLLHASALALDEEAYLFTAPSGTGKSTHAALWRQRFAERVSMLNDDKPVLRLQNGRFVVYGTPWGGKHQLQSNDKAPLRAVSLLRQSSQNSIRRLEQSRLLPILLNQTLRPSETQAMQHLLDLLQYFTDTIPIYELNCTISAEAVELAYGAMKGGLA